MIKFKDFFEQKKPKKLKSEMKARHMHPIGLDPNSHPKHPGRFVPKMHQVKQENPKLTRMKAGTSKREILASWDVKQITRQFELSPDINKPKKLGNTGIIMRYEPRYKKFILESSTNNINKIWNVSSDNVYYGGEKWAIDLEDISQIPLIRFPWCYEGAKVRFKDKNGVLYLGEVGEILEGSDNEWAYLKNVTDISKFKPKDQQTGADLLNI